MNQKIKILYIHHGTNIGGAPISLLNMVKNIDAACFDVKVAFVRDSEAVDLFRRNGINVDVINSSNVWFSHAQTGNIQFWYFNQYWRVIKNWLKVAYREAPAYLANQDADIVHLNSHVLTSWAFAAKALGFKVVLHNREAVARGYLGLRRHILKLLITRYTDHLIHISKDNKQRLGIEDNTSVIYNFIGIPPYYRPSMYESDQSRKVLYLGGMATIKGFKTVVSCLPFLDKNVTIQFAGYYGNYITASSAKEYFINFIKLNLYRNTYRFLPKLYAASNAVLLGLINNPIAVINDCDILITPFAIGHFSRPAIEAFAYGKPVIGSDVEGMEEIIDHGINGMLVKKNDAKALADAINYLCRNPDLACEMGRRGRKKLNISFHLRETCG